jgi:hypothetical protein
MAFNAADLKRNRITELKAIIKDQLDQKQEWHELKTEELAVRDKKKRIVDCVLADSKSEVDEINSLTLDLKNQNQLICDVALKDYLAGESITIKDKYGNELEPVFSVKFKKAK